ncbi:MAG: 23S rRNA (guanosine(2251)-2'-O)-methyltransferase RlmB [Actinomycetota bacterium]
MKPRRTSERRNGTRRGPDRRDEPLWITGRRAVAEAIRGGLAREVLVGGWVRSTPALRGVLDAAEQAGLEPREVPRSTLDGMGTDHHGVAARVHLPRELRESDILQRSFGPRDILVVLDGVTDPHNLGAAARAAEAAGVRVMVTRERRSAGISPAAIRASAGALLHLPLARVTNLRRTLENLKDRGVTVIGLDGSARATIYDAPGPESAAALVIGSEGAGLSRLVREGCDILVSLPMRGRVESLNASAALAAALFAYVLPSMDRQSERVDSEDAGVAQSGSASDL